MNKVDASFQAKRIYCGRPQIITAARSLVALYLKGLSVLRPSFACLPRLRPHHKPAAFRGKLCDCLDHLPHSLFVLLSSYNSSEAPQKVLRSSIYFSQLACRLIVRKLTGSTARRKVTTSCPETPVGGNINITTVTKMVW